MPPVKFYGVCEAPSSHGFARDCGYEHSTRLADFHTTAHALAPSEYGGDTPVSPLLSATNRGVLLRFSVLTRMARTPTDVIQPSGRTIS